MGTFYEFIIFQDLSFFFQTPFSRKPEIAAKYVDQSSKFVVIDASSPVPGKANHPLSTRPYYPPCPQTL